MWLTPCSFMMFSLRKGHLQLLQRLVFFPEWERFTGTSCTSLQITGPAVKSGIGKVLDLTSVLLSCGLIPSKEEHFIKKQLSWDFQKGLKRTTQKWGFRNVSGLAQACRMQSQLLLRGGLQNSLLRNPNMNFSSSIRNYMPALASKGPPSGSHWAFDGEWNACTAAHCSEVEVVRQGTVQRGGLLEMLSPAGEGRLGQRSRRCQICDRPGLPSQRLLSAQVCLRSEAQSR
jgi:hypothetical protein